MNIHFVCADWINKAVKIISNGSKRWNRVRDIACRIAVWTRFGLRWSVLCRQVWSPAPPRPPHIGIVNLTSNQLAYPVIFSTNTATTCVLSSALSVPIHTVGVVLFAYSFFFSLCSLHYLHITTSVYEIAPIYEIWYVTLHTIAVIVYACCAIHVAKLMSNCLKLFVCRFRRRKVIFLLSYSTRKNIILSTIQFVSEDHFHISVQIQFQPFVSLLCPTYKCDNIIFLYFHSLLFFSRKKREFVYWVELIKWTKLKARLVIKSDPHFIWHGPKLEYSFFTL